MSNVAMWSRPTWTFDQMVRDFLAPASANEAFPSGFNPAAEIVKDGDGAQRIAIAKWWFRPVRARSGPHPLSPARMGHWPVWPHGDQSVLPCAFSTEETGGDSVRQ